MCCMIFFLCKLPVYWKERALKHDLQMEGSKQWNKTMRVTAFKSLETENQLRRDG